MERNTERAFLKLLIAHDTSKESQQLQHSLSQAERDEKCIRRALSLVVMLFMLSLVGLGYCAILFPEVLYQSRYHVLSGLGGLGLGSVISLVGILTCLLWHSVAVSRLHRTCRLRLLAKIQLQRGTAPSRADGFSEASPGASGGLPARQVGMPPDGQVS
jgi:hypothetical protein